jgi:hemoglobin
VNLLVDARVRSIDAAARDLTTPTDVHDLVVAFYREVVFDDLLGPVFDEVAEVDWAAHIPRLVAYWCRILLGASDYGGTVTATHRRLHEMEPMGPEHCDRWFGLWVRSVDARWAGPVADRAKEHAASLMGGLARRVFGFEWAARDAEAQPIG